MTKRSTPLPTHLTVREDQGLIVVLMVEDGEQTTRFFADAIEPDERYTDAGTRAALQAIGAWADLDWDEEALIALDVIKQTSMPTVVTLSVHQQPRMGEGWSVAETCQRLEAAGADVVGVNCIRGPRTMLPLIKAIREAISCHVAALPVPYRTHDDQPTFQSLRDPAYPDVPGDRSFPTALDPFVCTRYEIADFARDAFDLGVRYLGVCCGAGPHHIRSMAEALGRTPPASRYSPDMSKHAFLGSEQRIKPEYRAYASEL